MSPKGINRSISTIRKRTALLLACALATFPLTGCLVLGGSSRGGFFIFPGSLGLIVLIVIVGLIFRRR